MFSDVFLDLFLKQVEGLLLVVFNLVDLLHKAVNIVRASNVHKELLALVKQVLQPTFCLFTVLHLSGIRQVIRRVLRVDIQELCKANVSKLIHNVPGVVLGDGELVKPHCFRPSTELICGHTLTCTNPFYLIC